MDNGYYWAKRNNSWQIVEIWAYSYEGATQRIAETGNECDFYPEDYDDFGDRIEIPEKYRES